MAKEHHLITRLQKLRPVFNAFFDRTATTKHATKTMHVSIASIVESARAIETALRHIDEGHFDSDELSHELAHLAQIGINWATTVELDGGYWGYALGLVDGDAFKEGAEYQSIERIDDFIQVLQQVKAVKLEIRDARDASKDDL